MAKYESFIVTTVIFVILSSASCTDDVTSESVMTLVQQQVSTIQSLQARVASLETSLHQQEASNQQQDNSIARLDTRVFFTAHMADHTVDLGTSNSPIKFESVVTNIGGYYNPHTGIFTAPVTGVYVFYAQLMKQGTESSIYYAIDKEGTLLCQNTVYAHLIYDKSSCLATAHVQKGENVFVRRTSGDTTILGRDFCSFSGFLVSTDA